MFFTDYNGIQDYFFQLCRHSDLGESHNAIFSFLLHRYADLLHDSQHVPVYKVRSEELAAPCIAVPFLAGLL